MNPPLTLFRWGYWGWGNSTRGLVQATDAIETARGFAPPVFVDTRISRSVRAVGFNGNAFGTLLGDRYVWMNGLGNLGVRDRTGDIRIHRPAEAGKLLEFAEALATENRRVIFFCSCEFPVCDGRECHRVEVGRLVLAEARRRSRDAVVEEWPGGVPATTTIPVPTDVFRKVRGTGKSVPLGKALPPADRLGLPWGTAATLRVETGPSLTILTGPAKFGSRGWELPVCRVLTADSDPTAETSTFRAERGYEPVAA